MKTNHITLAFLTILVVSVIASCKKKDDFTIEDKPVSGEFTYVVTSMTPIAFDTASGQPIAMAIVMQGTGVVTDLGNLTMQASFNFNLITGEGTDFVTTYTGDNPSDIFHSSGTSQQQNNGSILVTESFGNGAGKFSKIKGGGQTTVILNQTGSGGTGTVAWTVTY